MAITDTSAHLKALFAASLDKIALGEDFGFDLTWQVAPTPAGPQVVYTFQITKPSPLLGHGPLCGWFQFTDLKPTADQIDQSVTAAVTQLRQAASKLLEQPNKPTPVIGLN